MSRPTSSTSPHLARFISDFTLGFSDGLTVPFALTAGLSSLGRTDTVIYAGLAELCAGSISMGIGGYLSALDSPQSAKGEMEAAESRQVEEESVGMLHRHGSGHGDNGDEDGSGLEDEEKDDSRDEELVRKYLEPLALPGPVVAQILSALGSQPGGMQGATQSLSSYRRASCTAIPAAEQGVPRTPVRSGLSISLGYITGGIIPLLPYFLAGSVGRGLYWSISLCLLALFTYGSGKSWLLRARPSTSWKSCLWEGFQMMILGALAAAAAVLCVNLVGSREEGQ